MTDTADLRRLLEEDDDFFVTLERKTILALLDERDHLADAYRSTVEELSRRTRRVAALEELLGEIVIEYPYLDPKHPWAGFVERARALLAAGSAEPEGSGSEGAAGVAAEPAAPHWHDVPTRGCSICDWRSAILAIEAEAAAPAGSLDSKWLAQAISNVMGDRMVNGADLRQADDIVAEYARLLLGKRDE